MLMREPGCGVGIARAHRLGNCGMLSHGLLAAVSEGELEAKEPVALLMQSLEYLERLPAAGRLVEREMELEIGAPERRHVAIRQRRPESLGRLARCRVVRRPHELCSA